MVRTDYSAISERYDKNYLRHQIPKDIIIEDLYLKNNKTIKILDLACGTGNYLEEQIKYYNNYDIKWYGIDLSEQMLQKAKEKKLNAELIYCDAHDLPFNQEYFDYVKVRFAIHHFENKDKVIKEISRVLKKSGILSILNLSHDYMKKSWVYDYFPCAIEIDQERFLSTGNLYNLISSNNFKIDAEIIVHIREYLYKDIILEVKNRDMSQLNIMSESEYQIGLNRIISDSNEKSVYRGDIAFLNFTCEKLPPKTSYNELVEKLNLDL